MSTRFSIVITTYNFERFARAAAESALSQSEASKEVILVDDGSTDGTVRSVQDLPGLKIVAQANSGVAAARKRGVEASCGEYLVFLDGDDELDVDYLRETSACLAANPEASFCYTPMKLFGFKTGLMELRDFNEEALILYGNYIGVGALQPRTLYDRVGGFAELPSYEDWDYWLRAVELGFKGVRLNKPLYFYRQHEPGVSRNADWSVQGNDFLDLMRRRHRRLYVKNRAKRLVRWRDWKGLLKLMVTLR